ncbi:hypothetical protein CEP54_012880 [Fusarium duplospermum]|uniref:Heterokaryon incompatibility domain-containing protein n=1 Tax=Fusarium duplospermum TaxID=1325734 RepID=A0A428P691_9HYPO|nr:hypothetical protein CEP54_012880 [Fusarium duplospermum]
MDSAMTDNRCRKCRELSKEFDRDQFDIIFSHYDSFQKLDVSAVAGCPLCQLLRRVLIFGAEDVEEVYLGTQIKVMRTGSKGSETRSLLVSMDDSEHDPLFGGILYSERHERVETIRRDTPRLHVPKLEQGAALFSDYLILSYCWGNGNLNARTTKDNFEQRRDKINLEELSQTILDAIDVTRALGQRYLFVDAICIIQHNQGEEATDWLTEAPLMGRYYQNALCTIAAVEAFDSSDGFLTERPGELYPASPVLLGQYHDVKEGEQPYDVYAQPFYPLWMINITSSPLYQRGWTLQERSLSNRVIHFGRDAVFWQCTGLQASECYPKGVPRSDFFGSVKSTHQQLLHSKDTSREQALGKYWFQLVEEYSLMDFTYFEDRLVAIQGIADKIQLFFPDKHAFGYFESQIIPGLAWHSTGLVIPEIKGKKIAPSWSWASSAIYDVKVVFDDPDNVPEGTEAKFEIASLLCETSSIVHIDRGCLVLSRVMEDLGKEDVFERIGWLELTEPLGQPEWRRKNITIV